MPKYYRFRATTPTRRPRRCKERERDREVENWLGLTLATCQTAPSWYLRRTSWRETAPLIGFPRQLAGELGAPLQLIDRDRPIFVFKIPPTSSQEWKRQFY